MTIKSHKPTVMSSGINVFQDKQENSYNVRAASKCSGLTLTAAVHYFSRSIIKSGPYNMDDVVHAGLDLSLDVIIKSIIVV